MAIEIAKLLVKIGADTKELEQKLAKSDKDVSGFGQGVQSALHTVSTGFATAGAAVTAFALTWKVMSEIAKQGAAIEYSAGRFDRLARSVGSVSDVMMTDLRAATKGTMSDAQLMQSAGDLMALGLAKTHDQVVRLSTVSAGLNMDMNQLVLTLANQTTMRFDQLGVSVAGFQEKVDALKASGMSANDAFNEAFLQQAEQQLQKVGNAADGAVGSMQRFDAAIADIVNALSRKWSPFLARAAEGGATLLNWGDNLQDMLKLHSREMIKSAGSYEAYAAEMTRAAEAAGYFVSENGDLMQKVFIPFKGIEEIVVQTDYLSKSLYLGARAALVFGNGMKDIQLDTSGADASGFDTLVEGAQRAKGELGNLITQIGNTEQTMENWVQGVGNQAVQMLGQSLWEGSDRFKQGLQVVDDVLGTSFSKEQAQKDSVKALVDQYARTGDLEAFNAGLTKIRDEGLQGMETVLEDTITRAGELYEKLTNLPAEVQVAIKFDIQELPKWLQNLVNTGTSNTTAEPLQSNAIGGPAWAGQPYLVGERGPEFFVPPESGRVVRNSDSAKGGRGVTLVNYGTVVSGDGDPFTTQLLAVLQ